MQAGPSTAPGSHSRTGSAHLPAKRLARRDVNTAGMCCAMTMGKGKLAGNDGKSLASASGPPVETPIATVLTVAGTKAGARGRIRGARTGAIFWAPAGDFWPKSTGKWQSALILGISSRAIAPEVESISEL